MNQLEQIFSKHLIKLIPDLHQAITLDLIKDKSRKIHEVPSLSCWLECYRCSKSIFNFSILSMLDTSDNASIFQEQFELSLLPKNKKKQLIENTITEIHAYSKQEQVKFNSELTDYVAQFKDDSDALFSETYKDVSREEARSFISNPEIQFFLRVIIPCLVLYGKFPSQLLRKARLGDEKAIKQLAQIDYSIIHDKKISKYLHNLSFRNPTHHKLLTRAMVRSHPKPRKKDLKIDAAALISLFNAMFCKVSKTKKMTAPQLRQIFVDEAKLHGRDDDIDLPQGDEAFYKSIKRNTMWEDLFKLPDKN